MVPFWVMFRKDLKLVYRNPGAFVLLLLMPFVLMAIVSEAFRPVFEGARSFDVPVVDLDGSSESMRILAELDELETVNLEPRSWDKARFEESDASDLFSGRRETSSF